MLAGGKGAIGQPARDLNDAMYERVTGKRYLIVTAPSND